MNNKVECPVDFIAVNENKVRIVAAQVFTASVLFAFTTYWPIVAVLAADFLLRATHYNRYSILSLAGSIVVKVFSVKEKLTDQAPKRFAAWIGFLLSSVILVLFFLHIQTTAVVLSIGLIVFSFLEAFVGFCAGCYIYSFGRKLLPVRK